MRARQSNSPGTAPAWLVLLKDYWWLVGLASGSLILWGNLPERVKKVEAGQASQQEELGVIREATKEIQGYLKGQQALNERLAAQQQAPAPFFSLPETRTPVSGHSRATAGHSGSETQELSDDGEIKTLNVNGVKLCCNGRTCWPWTSRAACER